MFAEKSIKKLGFSLRWRELLSWGSVGWQGCDLEGKRLGHEGTVPQSAESLLGWGVEETDTRGDRLERKFRGCHDVSQAIWRVRSWSIRQHRKANTGYLNPGLHGRQAQEQRDMLQCQRLARALVEAQESSWLRSSKERELGSARAVLLSGCQGSQSAHIWSTCYASRRRAEGDSDQETALLDHDEREERGIVHLMRRFNAQTQTNH